MFANNVCECYISDNNGGRQWCSELRTGDPLGGLAGAEWSHINGQS